MLGLQWGCVNGGVGHGGKAGLTGHVVTCMVWGVETHGRAVWGIEMRGHVVGHRDAWPRGVEAEVFMLRRT